MQLSLNTVGAVKDQVGPRQLQLLPLGQAHVARHNYAALQTVPFHGIAASKPMVSRARCHQEVVLSLLHFGELAVSPSQLETASSLLLFHFEVKLARNNC